MSTALRYVKHHQIDFARWDASLAGCYNQLLYAESTYLNGLAGTWHAVIGGDYDILMPLPCKQKMGIRYTPAIPFIQQLGVFSKQPLPGEVLTDCLALATTHIRYGDFVFNYGNAIANSQPHQNYLLSLQTAYEQLAAAYHKDLRNNLKQAAKHDLVYAQSSDYQNVIDLFAVQYAKALPQVSAADYLHFSKLCAHYQPLNRLHCREVKDMHHTTAAAILIQYGNRLYNLLSVTLPEGRKQSANHFLYDSLIREFAGHDVLLDFEGSDVPGIASFYQNFGGFNQSYYSLHVNQLPWPLRMLGK
jgi:UDP-N-acetylglucosamine transferase subunit ALG13